MVLGVVSYISHLRVQEMEPGGLWAWGLPGLHMEFKVSLGYIVRLKNIQTNQEKRYEIDWLIFIHLFG